MRSTLLTLVLVSGWVSHPIGQAPEARLKQLAEQGERALAEYRYAEAQQAYEELRRLSPGTAEVHARLGLIYFQQGRFSDAIETLQRALKLKPALPNVDVLLAMSLSELGRYEEALPALEKGFRATSDVGIRRMAGLQLQRACTGLRRDRRAVEVALELTRLYPDDPEVLYHASRLFANFAYLTTRELSRVAPESVWMHLTAGEVLESQGEYAGALSEYRKVVVAESRRPGIHYRIGRVLLASARRAGNPADAENEALKEFEQEIALDPTNANAAYEAGEVCRKSGELDRARQFFTRALAFYPDFEEALIGLARTLVATGAPREALPHLHKAVSLNPSNEVAYYHLAQAHRALGNTAEQEKALVEYQRLRAEGKGQPDVVASSRQEVTRQKVDPQPPE